MTLLMPGQKVESRTVSEVNYKAEIEEDVRRFPLKAPLIPKPEDLEAIVQTFVGIALSAIVTTLASKLSARYSVFIYFTLAFIGWFWLAYRKRTRD